MRPEPRPAPTPRRSYAHSGSASDPDVNQPGLRPLQSHRGRAPLRGWPTGPIRFALTTYGAIIIEIDWWAVEDVDWMSTTAAARHLGLTPATLHLFIDGGDLPAHRSGEAGAGRPRRRRGRRPGRFLAMVDR